MCQKQLAESNVTAKQQTTCRRPESAAARSPQDGFHSAIFHLQRTLGNQRVAQLIQAKRLTPDGRILGLQPKLTVGAADDQYEQEADRVARQVVSMPDSAVSADPRPAPPVGEVGQAHTVHGKPFSMTVAISPFVQREMGGGMEEEETSDKEKETEPIQAKSAESLSGSFEAGPDVESRLSQSKGSGSPLPDSVRAYMEPRFGVDFSHVRAHTGRDAIQMNRGIGAQAFTHGSDIYYGAGSGPDNLELTAHELTHVIQQSDDADRRKPVAGASNVQPALIQREPMLSAAGLELAAQHAPRMAVMLQEYGTLLETGAIAAEEAAAISTAIAEAEITVAAAAELAAAGSAATIAGEASLVATAGLAADDVTGIGVADDVAIPFTLIFGLVAIGVGAGIAYAYRDEISAALAAAINKVTQLVQLIEEVIARHRGTPPVSVPVPGVDTPPVTPPISEPNVGEESLSSREPRPLPVPRPDVDTDFDGRRRGRGRCRYEPVAQQFGRFPCHAAYATSLSGVSREVRITTPEQVSVEFDAIDAGGQLYEVKTGHRSLAFDSNETRRQGTITRFYNQVAKQLIVAERCGHPLSWYFSDDYAASVFGAENSPHPEYELVPLPVPVWYVPFDCPMDSD